jgi:hypothetical protein
MGVTGEQHQQRGERVSNHLQAASPVRFMAKAVRDARTAPRAEAPSSNDVLHHPHGRYLRAL